MPTKVLIISEFQFRFRVSNIPKNSFSSTTNEIIYKVLILSNRDEPRKMATT